MNKQFLHETFVNNSIVRTGKKLAKHLQIIFRIVVIILLVIIFSRDKLFTIMESSLVIILILTFIMDDIHKLTKK